MAAKTESQIFILTRLQENYITTAHIEKMISTLKEESEVDAVLQELQNLNPEVYWRNNTENGRMKKKHVYRAFNVLNQGEMKKFLSVSTKLSKSLDIPKKLNTAVTKPPKKCGTGCRLAHLLDDSGETHFEAPSELIFPDLRLGKSNPKYSLLIKELVVQKVPWDQICPRSPTTHIASLRLIDDVLTQELINSNNLNQKLCDILTDNVNTVKETKIKKRDRSQAFSPSEILEPPTKRFEIGSIIKSPSDFHRYSSIQVDLYVLLF